MEDIFVRQISLPPTIKAFVVRDEQCDYNIYINDALSLEATLEAYAHEIWHIENNDFDSTLDIQTIEERAEKAAKQRTRRKCV